MSCECDHSTLEIILRDVVECEQVKAPCVVEIIGVGPQGPPGTPGGGLSLNALVVGEIPTGTINEVNMVYTTASNFDKIMVYLNGVRMQEGLDYNITDTNEITFTYAPWIAATLQVDYVPTA